MLGHKGVFVTIVAVGKKSAIEDPISMTFMSLVNSREIQELNRLFSIHDHNFDLW